MSILIAILLFVPIQQRQMTPSEKVFFGAALSYLKTAQTEGTALAKTMAGASNGTSTLGDIKAALGGAMKIEAIGYEGDYRARIKNGTPSSGADLASQIDETHRLFQAAIKEQLEYWKDQNTAHIASGNLTLKRSMELMNRAISAGAAKMKQFTK